MSVIAMGIIQKKKKTVLNKIDLNLSDERVRGGNTEIYKRKYGVSGREIWVKSIISK